MGWMVPLPDGFTVSRKTITNLWSIVVYISMKGGMLWGTSGLSPESNTHQCLHKWLKWRNRGDAPKICGWHKPVGYCWQKTASRFQRISIDLNFGPIQQHVFSDEFSCNWGRKNQMHKYKIGGIWLNNSIDYWLSISTRKDKFVWIPLLPGLSPADWVVAVSLGEPPKCTPDMSRVKNGILPDSGRSKATLPWQRSVEVSSASPAQPEDGDVYLASYQ